MHGICAIPLLEKFKPKWRKPVLFFRKKTVTQTQGWAFSLDAA
jgi:hypothetical protein